MREAGYSGGHGECGVLICVVSIIVLLAWPFHPMSTGWSSAAIGRMLPEHPVDVMLWLSGAVDFGQMFSVAMYRGTSLMRNSPPLGPYIRTKPRALWWS